VPFCTFFEQNLRKREKYGNYVFFVMLKLSTAHYCGYPVETHLEVYNYYGDTYLCMLEIMEISVIFVGISGDRDGVENNVLKFSTSIF
jgi:hypothetical protein